MAPERPVAVVTGASRGIGRAIAEKLAGAGYEVWALARSREALELLKKDVAAKGGSLRPWPCDVSRPEDVSQACAEIGKGAVPEVLVNNAGVALSAPLGKTTFEDYERVMAINVRSAFLFCRELVPKMAARGHGRVINIASTAALKGFKYTAAYCASKHALLGLTRALAVEIAGKGVTVNAICPGWTDTDILTAASQVISKTTGRSEDEARRTLAEMNPMKRLIQPDEVAALCLFLASPEAATVTGAAYAIDGGESAA